MAAFGGRLSEAATCLRVAPDPLDPASAWAGCEALVAELSVRSRRHTLRLAHVAPALAALRDSNAPVPGLGDGSVTVAAVGATVHVLGTKTRPKRIVLLGSDGRRYPFLLKGREDLVRNRIVAMHGAVLTSLHSIWTSGSHSCWSPSTRACAPTVPPPPGH
jgi:PI-3-kinase-related kinase SMG-1